MNKKFVLSFLILALSLSGCQKYNENHVKKKITIACQYGLTYTPAIVMEKRKLLEKYLPPDVEVRWLTLSSGSAINEGIISGDIDVAMMGVAPFLIGWSKEVPYKIYSGISALTLGLVTLDEDIQELSDFTGADRIALPSVGSIQHIYLAMAAEKELGDMHALDGRLAAMSHPDGMAALLSKQEVKGHYTSPPYLNLELEQKGAHLVTTAQDVMGGDYTFIVAVASDQLAEEEPELFQAVVKATQDGLLYVKENPEETAGLMSEIEGIPKEDLLKYLKEEKDRFRSELRSVLDVSDFMFRAGYIKKAPASEQEIVFP